MGFHSFLQARGLPFEGAMAKSRNLKIFKHISAQADEASMMLAQERGPCPDAADMGAMERFSAARWRSRRPRRSASSAAAPAPVSSRSRPTSTPTRRCRAASSVKNPYLEKLLDEKAKNSDKVWNSILEKGGSVQHLDFLSAEEKATYKTSFEIDQRWLLEFAGDRAPFIDQAQSLNLFIPADVDKWDLLMLHFRAWELGIKSLYYLRSKSVQRAGFAGGVEADNTPELARSSCRRPITTMSRVSSNVARLAGSPPDAESPGALTRPGPRTTSFPGAQAAVRPASNISWAFCAVADRRTVSPSSSAIRPAAGS